MPNKGSFKKGVPRAPTAGRKPGSQNALTRTVKEHVLSVFNELQEDHKANMLAWAKREPTEFYKISAKLIPAEINAHLDGKIITVVNPNQDAD